MWQVAQPVSTQSQSSAARRRIPANRAWCLQAQKCVTDAINPALLQRYGALAQQDTCLSCGTAASRLEPAEGEICADLGCGRGKDVLELAAKVGPRGHVYGLDASPQMLETARARAAFEGVIQVTFRESALEALALPDASVDWVVSNCALNHARDKAQVWREIARVLRPGGRFVVSDIYAVEEIAPEHRNDPVAVAECWAGAELRADYLAHVAAAGLGELAVSEESQPYRRAQSVLASFTLSGRKPRAEEVME